MILFPLAYITEFHYMNTLTSHKTTYCLQLSEAEEKKKKTCTLKHAMRETKGNRSKMKILSSGVVFTFEEDISTSHVCHKGQQPIF